MLNLNLNWVSDAIKLLQQWWPVVKSNFQTVQDAFNGHVGGTTDRHSAQDINYLGNAVGSTVKEGIDNTDAKIDNHVSGASEKHTAVNIDYAGNVEGTANVKDALDEVRRLINEVVVSASVDPEVALARINSVLNMEFATLKDVLEYLAGQGPGYTYEGKRFTINNPYRFGGVLSLKGQLHCHSTNSVGDGINTPESLVTAYKNAGYNFVSITDHDYATPDPGVPGITFIPGCEESGNRDVVVYNVSGQTNDYTVQSIIDYHRANNSISSIAHPSLCGSYTIDKYELSLYRDYNFIEVFNALADNTGEKQVDYALSNGNKVFLTAVDDCHNTETIFNKGWVIAKADENTLSSVLTSLRNGNFYASTGNDISVEVTGNIITASSTELSNISFIGRNGRILQTNNGVASASYTIKGDEMYVRIKSVKVSDSTCAWSNPVFVDCLDSRPLSDITPYYQSANKLINGNFDLWPKGVSFVYSSSAIFAANWGFYAASGGGVLPTISISRQADTNIDGSYWFHQVDVNGSGSSLGSGSGGGLYQLIHKGTKYLCGKGKTVTVSFYAKSNIPNKKLGVYLIQNYGTGGTPSGQETINGVNWTLTSQWVKYKHTFTTNTLLNKNFGSDNNDYLNLTLSHFWGTDVATRVGASEAETFVGAGNIGIRKIQLCAGDQDLPFVEKNDTLEAKASYEKSYDSNVAPGTPLAYGGIGRFFAHTSINANTVGTLYPNVSFEVEKKAISSMSIKLYALDGTPNAISVNEVTRTGATVPSGIFGTKGFSQINLDNTSAIPVSLGNLIEFHWEVQC